MNITIDQRIRAVLSQELGVTDDRIHADARLKEDMGADSTDSYSLVLALEDEFSIEIEERDIPELRTVRTLTHYIAVRVGTAAA